jgi:hypothetical protein
MFLLAKVTDCYWITNSSMQKKKITEKFRYDPYEWRSHENSLTMAMISAALIHLQIKLTGHLDMNLTTMLYEFTF